MRETIKLVGQEGGNVVGFVVALDRCEKMPGPREKERREQGEEDGIDEEPRTSAMGQIRQEFGVPTASIVTLHDLIALLKAKGGQGDVERMEEYRRRYRASD